jgi:ABC-type polysaccharide/polyol phosphate export permease
MTRLWRYRELLRSLIVRNLRLKYQRSVLGFVWTLANPLLTVAVLAVVFTHVVRIQLPHYLAFLLSGYFVWNFMAQTISAGTYLLSEHAQMARSVAFPKEILVIAGVVSRLAEFAIETTLLLAALVALHHHGVPASFAWLPALVALQTLLALGLALPIATLSVFYRDVQHIIPICLTVLFYLCPVFYPASMVPEHLQTAYLVNPVSQLLTAYHIVLYEGRTPPAALLGSLTIASGLIAWAGYVLFQRHNVEIPEVI